MSCICPGHPWGRRWVSCEGWHTSRCPPVHSINVAVPGLCWGLQSRAATTTLPLDQPGEVGISSVQTELSQSQVLQETIGWFSWTVNCPKPETASMLLSPFMRKYRCKVTSRPIRTEVGVCIRSGRDSEKRCLLLLCMWELFLAKITEVVMFFSFSASCHRCYSSIAKAPSAEEAIKVKYWKSYAGQYFKSWWVLTITSLPQETCHSSKKWCSVFWDSGAAPTCLVAESLGQAIRTLWLDY